MRRIPGSLSGAPAIDNIFQDVWLALATIQLWGFLYSITLMTVWLGAIPTTIIFTGLLILFMVALASHLGLSLHRTKM